MRPVNDPLDLVERQIRDAIERGEFDDLPGAGRPLDLGDDDPDWWAKRKIRELKAENDVDALADDFQRSIDALWHLSDESAVRDQVHTINDRVRAVKERLGDKFRVPTIAERDAVRTWRAMSRIRRNG